MSNPHPSAPPSAMVLPWLCPWAVTAAERSAQGWGSIWDSVLESRRSQITPRPLEGLSLSIFCPQHPPQFCRYRCNEDLFQIFQTRSVLSCSTKYDAKRFSSAILTSSPCVCPVSGSSFHHPPPPSCLAAALISFVHVSPGALLPGAPAPFFCLQFCHAPRDDTGP